MYDLLQMLDVAVAAVRAGGEIVRARTHERRTFEQKTSHRDLVTAVDKAVEAEIVQRMRTAFPDHGLVGEEGTRHGAGTGPIWYLDPVDGTNNFIAGLPHICTSLACYENGEPLVAVVYDPHADELFSAARGHGAYLNGRRLQVDDAPDLSRAILAGNSLLERQRSPEELQALNRLAMECRALRCLGAAALDLAWVAAGRVTCFFQLRLAPWDMAAGVLLVREAGGMVGHPDGSPLDVNRPGVVASNNPQVHAQLLAGLRPLVQP